MDVLKHQATFGESAHSYGSIYGRRDRSSSANLSSVLLITPLQVGVAAELPSGKHSSSNLDFSAYWQFLLDGLEAYETIPGDRFNIEG